jgi:signal transduction histidine kinase
MVQNHSVNVSQPELLMELDALCVSYAALGTGRSVEIFSWNAPERLAFCVPETSIPDPPRDPGRARKFFRIWDESGSLGHLAVDGPKASEFSEDEEPLLEKIARRLGQWQFAVRQTHHRDFIFGLLHDLRGPLRRVGSIVEFLKEASSWPPELEGSLDREIHSAEWVLRQAGVVASSAREWSRETCDPRRAWSEAEYRLHHLYPHLRAQYSLETNCDRLAAIAEDDLTEVLVQLLHNSLKFGGEPRHVWASIGVTGFVMDSGAEMGVRIEIRDNGQSFDPAHLPKLFRPFYRGHAPSYPGAGLGLFACREIVRRARGKIDAHVDSSTGSLGVSLWLPFG